MDFNGSLTFRVAQNFLHHDNYHYFLSIITSDGEAPEFDYNITFNETTPSVFEIQLYELRFTDAGRYTIDLTEFYVPADSRDFVVTVNRKCQPVKLNVCINGHCIILSFNDNITHV